MSLRFLIVLGRVLAFGLYEGLVDTRFMKRSHGSSDSYLMQDTCFCLHAPALNTDLVRHASTLFYPLRLAQLSSYKPGCGSVPTILESITS